MDSNWIYLNPYLCLFKGDFPSSAVGRLCSPGLIHKMGPSLLSVGGIFSNDDISPQGITYKA